MTDLGPRCDVLTNCSRSAGILFAIRSLAPDIIITDELGFKDDADAVNNALKSGITVIASIHAGSIENLKEKELLRNTSFERYIHLHNNYSGLTYNAYDRDFMPVKRGGIKRCCI